MAHTMTSTIVSLALQSDPTASVPAPLRMLAWFGTLLVVGFVLRMVLRPR